MMYPHAYFMDGGEYASSEFIVFKLLGMFLLLVVLVVFLRKWRDSGHIWHCDCNSDTAMNLLRERYVKGEIDRHEFESKKKDLNS